MKIKKEIFDEMISHCVASLPYEACGILAGKHDMVTKIYKIKNIENSSVSYLMEPKEQLRAMKDIKNKGLEMVAIFHSHPSGSAYPSSKDIELSFYDVYHVIVALEPDFEVKCFKINDGKVYEEELVIEQ
ncbi:MAG: M67 family metallopeptidase [Thermodesulfovibrio sp.]|jgi:proteasome lid subunit RPN8/RPN11|uniref:M67 family metallopeptidase n=1 Tax=Thermodesulfovibrio obliviosus TaxID=3118332 RepID=A0AAU8H3I7_9BACT